VKDKWKYSIIGALSGTAATMVFALPSLIPLAWAHEQPISTLQTAKHQALKLFDRDNDLFKPQWSTEPSVSQEVASSYEIRKIEAGKTSFVQVVNTPSGVYSSDALDSPHVRYPGIHRDKDREFDAIAYLSGGGWIGIKLRDADSFRALVPMPSGGFAVVRQ
jgi:acetyl esterase/lipase